MPFSMFKIAPNLIRTIGGFKFSREDVAERRFPRITRLFSGAAHESGTLTPGTGVAISRDTSVYESGGGSIKLVVNEDAEATVYIDLPAPVYCLGQINFRVRCSNWANVKRLYFMVSATAGSTAGKFHAERWDTTSIRGAATYPWDADQWRWIRTVAPQWATLGAGDGEAWDASTDANAKKTINRIGIRIKAENAETTFYLDRVEAEEWPKAFFSITGDGFYDTFDTYVAQPFWDRGWRFSATIAADDVMTPARLAVWASRCGRDISQHGMLAGSTAWNLGTSAQAEEGLLSRAAAYRHAYGADVFGKIDWFRHLYAVLGNSGASTDGETAYALRRAGVLSARGYVSDPIFGYDGGALGDNAGVFCPWIPIRGPYNYQNRAFETYAWDSTWIPKAIRWKLGVKGYLHRVASSIARGQWSFSDVNAMMSDLEQYQNQLEFVTQRELYESTYGAAGDLYVDHLGCWKSRDDPDKII